MPAATTNGTAESPNGVIASSADLERAGRLEEAPLAALQDAEHHEPKPDRRKTPRRRGRASPARPMARAGSCGCRR